MNYEEAVPQPLNPEAHKKARQLDEVVGAAEVVAGIAVKHAHLRKERQSKIMAVALQLRDLMKSTDDEMNKLREEGLQEIKKIEKQHDTIIAEIRDAQPELRNHEFSLDAEAGTYTLVSARDPDEIEVRASTILDISDEEAKIKATVDALLAKYMKPDA